MPRADLNKQAFLAPSCYYYDKTYLYKQVALTYLNHCGGNNHLREPIHSLNINKTTGFEKSWLITWVVSFQRLLGGSCVVVVDGRCRQWPGDCVALDFQDSQFQNRASIEESAEYHLFHTDANVSVNMMSSPPAHCSYTQRAVSPVGLLWWHSNHTPDQRQRWKGSRASGASEAASISFADGSQGTYVREASHP